MIYIIDASMLVLITGLAAIILSITCLSLGFEIGYKHAMLDANRFGYAFVKKEIEIRKKKLMVRNGYDE